MDVREKLVEMIDDFIHNVDLKHWYSEELDEKLADELIAHGVTVQERNKQMDDDGKTAKVLPDVRAEIAPTATSFYKKVYA